MLFFVFFPSDEGIDEVDKQEQEVKKTGIV